MQTEQIIVSASETATGSIKPNSHSCLDPSSGINKHMQLYKQNQTRKHPGHYCHSFCGQKAAVTFFAHLLGASNKQKLKTHWAHDQLYHFEYPTSVMEEKKENLTVKYTSYSPICETMPKKQRQMHKVMQKLAVALPLRGSQGERLSTRRQKQHRSWAGKHIQN